MFKQSTVQREQYDAVLFNSHLQSALNTTHVTAGEQAVTIVTTIARHKLSASVQNHVALGSGSDVKKKTTMSVGYGPGSVTTPCDSAAQLYSALK